MLEIIKTKTFYKISSGDYYHQVTYICSKSTTETQEKAVDMIKINDKNITTTSI